MLWILPLMLLIVLVFIVGAEAATTPFVPAVSEGLTEGRCFCVYIIVLLLFHFYSSFLLSLRLSSESATLHWPEFRCGNTISSPSPATADVNET